MFQQPLETPNIIQIRLFSAKAGLMQRSHIGLDQRSYSTLGSVSTWVGDRLWMGKPPWHKTRHPGLLSLWLGWNVYLAKAGE